MMEKTRRSSLVGEMALGLAVLGLAILPSPSSAARGGLPLALADCEAELTECQTDLNECGTQAATCAAERDACGADLDTCNADLVTCRRDPRCGDTASEDGSDIPCVCGDTVVTNTTLDPSLDPVTTTACSGNGLTLASGVVLDLNGSTVRGGGAGDGISVPSGGKLTHGTVRGFRTGLHIQTATNAGEATVTGIAIEDNAADGAVIEATAGESRVVFDGVSVRRNGGHGIHVRGAAGSSNLETDEVLERSEYGFVLQNVSTVQGNAAYGIRLGDPAQPADVAALIDGATISGNGSGGIVMEQKDGVAPGSDCGASAEQPGCTGATIVLSSVHDNGGAGVELRAGFVIPADESQLGFRGNQIFHNAMASAGCSAAQSAPQIIVTGPVALGDGACSDAADALECRERSLPGGNRHCVWDDALACRAAWDLRGAHTEQGCAQANRIFDYNIEDQNSPLAVGIRVIDGARVLATHNFWRGGNVASTGGGAFVEVEPDCGSIGCTAP